MDRLRNKYNPEYYYVKALEARDDVTREEALAWYQHPCTVSLRNSLEGDMAGIVTMWLGGGYSEQSSSDGTAQMQAKARGMAQSIDEILEHIEEMKIITQEGERKDGENPY